MTLKERVLAACYGTDVVTRRDARRAEEAAIAKPLQARVNALSDLVPSMTVVSKYEAETGQEVHLPVDEVIGKNTRIPFPTPEGAAKRTTNGDLP